MKEGKHTFGITVTRQHQGLICTKQSVWVSEEQTKTYKKNDEKMGPDALKRDSIQSKRTMIKYSCNCKGNLKLGVGCGN
jgi:hypothetical protein